MQGDPDAVIDAVTADSREAGPGVLFVAVRGTGGDGHRLPGQAVAAPAATRWRSDAAAAAEFRGRLTPGRPTPGRPALAGPSLHGKPDDRLVTAGVTGTNGKTTVAFLLQALLGNLAGPCGLLGTIRYDDGNDADRRP